MSPKKPPKQPATAGYTGVVARPPAVAGYTGGTGYTGTVPVAHPAVGYTGSAASVTPGGTRRVQAPVFPIGYPSTGYGDNSYSEALIADPPIRSVTRLQSAIELLDSTGYDEAIAAGHRALEGSSSLTGDDVRRLTDADLDSAIEINYESLPGSGAEANQDVLMAERMRRKIRYAEELGDVPIGSLQDAGILEQALQAANGATVDLQDDSPDPFLIRWVTDVGGVLANSAEAVAAYQTVVRLATPLGTAGPVAKPTNVQDVKLQKVVDDLYRKSGSFGNGGTADAVWYEMRVGNTYAVGGKQHLQKAVETVTRLERWIQQNPRAAAGDRFAAESMLKDLQAAIRADPTRPFSVK